MRTLSTRTVVTCDDGCACDEDGQKARMEFFGPDVSRQSKALLAAGWDLSGPREVCPECLAMRKVDR